MARVRVSLVRISAFVGTMCLALLPLSAHAQAAEPDDAGSGRDAGADFATAVPIEPGVDYTGSLDPSVDREPFDIAGDEDWFAFPAKAGQRISAEFVGSTLSPCATLVAPDGSELGSGCEESHRDVLAPVDGTYALTVRFSVAAQEAYSFTVGLDLPPFDYGMGTPSDPSAVGPGQVVVAVADSGVNPYHTMYHRPQNTAHPCTWVEGFDDCSIPALELSIGEYDTFAEAFEADRDFWESVERHQWYWIPQTNIIGAVCDVPYSSETQPDAGATCIYDDHSHGTATTSSVLSEAPDALLLVHEGTNDAYDLASTPVVPDIQSHSWGAPAPLPLHVVDPVWHAATGEPFWGNFGAFDPETIRFLAAGNFAPFPTFLDFTKVHPDVQVVGGGFPGSWVAGSHSAYDFASWWCRPGARHDHVADYGESYCGTSLAAPTVAGTAAAALLEIRRHEGTMTRSSEDMVSETVSRDEFIAALRAAATYDPEADRFPTKPYPSDFAVPLIEGTEHLSWGYGWLDRTRVDAIVACALDDICPAKSPEAEQYNAYRQEIRKASTTYPVR
jgi:hypothetical protein